MVNYQYYYRINKYRPTTRIPSRHVTRKNNKEAIEISDNINKLGDFLMSKKPDFLGIKVVNSVEYGTLYRVELDGFTSKTTINEINSLGFDYVKTVKNWGDMLYFKAL